MIPHKTVICAQVALALGNGQDQGGGEAAAPVRREHYIKHLQVALGVFRIQILQAAVENQVGQGQGGEAQVNALGSGLGGVTDKGACADRLLCQELQVVELRVECGCVELQAVIQ